MALGPTVQLLRAVSVVWCTPHPDGWLFVQQTTVWLGTALDDIHALKSWTVLPIAGRMATIILGSRVAQLFSYLNYTTAADGRLMNDNHCTHTHSECETE